MPRKNNPTWISRYLAYMSEHGYIEVESASKRYRCFKITVKGEEQRRYWLGKAGAVRVSAEGVLAESIAITEMFQRFVMMWEKRRDTDETNA